MKVGVLGGGQLGRMLGLAGVPMGLSFSFFDPADEACASEVGSHIRAAWDDFEALAAFARKVDVVTWEFENVPLAAVDHVAKYCAVYPNRSALEATQDRLREKDLFGQLGIPTPPFFPVDDIADLRTAVKVLGYPVVLKSRTGGYDGKGQVVIREERQLEPRYAETGGDGLIAETFIAFDREVSMVAVRGASGETAFYDLVENRHADGILRTSFNRPGDPIRDEAERLVSLLFEALDYRGVLALEFFQTGGRLLANEYAPRVHNTGHWTIEGAATSQFENHLRAVLGWPLGDTTSMGYSAMINFIGEYLDPALCLQTPDSHYHSYGKTPRPGRKVGHLTIRAPSAELLRQQVGIVAD
jgi:5-(carboxyamino)imidazole ribonucleotide synthase